MKNLINAFEDFKYELLKDIERLINISFNSFSFNSFTNNEASEFFQQEYHFLNDNEKKSYHEVLEIIRREVISQSNKNLDLQKHLNIQFYESELRSIKEKILFLKNTIYSTNIIDVLFLNDFIDLDDYFDFFNTKESFEARELIELDIISDIKIINEYNSSHKYNYQVSLNLKQLNIILERLKINLERSIRN